MDRRFEDWRAQAKRFETPLDDSSMMEATRQLHALAPILIGNVLLKIESCDWPYPFNTGNQFFGQNSFGRAIQDDEDLDHGGPLQTEKLRMAIKWAELQDANPEQSKAMQRHIGAINNMS
ncbi:hypothetical protein [Herbaspirillum sp. RV1423]|uniref:hypothetical protein n=1 Tax=Herbaspirillum sp. RV1423 TaxID=1443993 RepID=UPI00054FFD67|nr:hypothetical protein [Herbaspirillum sp. RV1423]